MTEPTAPDGEAQAEVSSTLGVEEISSLIKRIDGSRTASRHPLGRREMLYPLARNEVGVCASTTEFSMLEVLAGAGGWEEEEGGSRSCC